MKNIYIIDTPYHLLISIVKTLLANRIGMDSIVIMKDSIPLHMINNSQIIFKDVKHCWNRYNILANLFTLKIQHWDIPIISEKLKKRNNILSFFTNNVEIFIYEDNSYLGCWLNNAQIYYNHIEDGLNSFKYEKLKNKRIKKYDCLYKLLGISWDYWGTSKFIKTIEVNENKNLRKTHGIIIEQKREEMFKKLSNEQINTIAEIFNYQPLNGIIPGDKTLLLTQPLEDGLMSREKKIKIYKYLVEKYGIGTLYIKVHPREKEDYSKIFPDAVILGDAKIPFEVYQLKENFHFKKAITTFSAAMDAVFCADEKIIFGRENTLNFPA